MRTGADTDVYRVCMGAGGQAGRQGPQLTPIGNWLGNPAERVYKVELTSRNAVRTYIDRIPSSDSSNGFVDKDMVR